MGVTWIICVVVAHTAIQLPLALRQVVCATVGVRVTQKIGTRVVIVVVTWIICVVVAHTAIHLPLALRQVAYATVGVRVTQKIGTRVVIVVVTWIICVVVAHTATPHVLNYKQKIRLVRTV